MSYRNPQVDHSMNVSPGSELGEFVRLAVWLLLGLVVAAAVLFFGMRWVAPWVPLSWEARLADPIVAQWRNSEPAADSPQQQWLNGLADTLRQPMGLPPDMPLHVHWSDSAIPNAFATLGGHVVVNRGLVEHIDSENALAMVLAHEMAHIRHRDPIVTLGAGLTLALGLNLVAGDLSFMTDGTAALTQLHFSRRQEAAADAAALDALERHYGHLNGADAFFAAMLAQAHSLERHVPQFLQSHPGLEQRLQTIERRRAALNSDAAPKPLPAFMRE